ncbi:DUF6902 family protein [Sedimentitalea todarodis]|uniref:Uncharacterized protein n=1 Tax=Sedimentitalea todarodis TaxID=1631240 RepID=A0ABU3VDL2_9RHOB|nr:hypothetical protein [Sedimentitalea todarodis]MDU9003824.1 hypothetical protein [Sedimentitalea todarodis]
MSNVIHLNVPSQRQSGAARRAALIASFAQYRRFGDDVFWLKENAELLNILECTGLNLNEQALTPHQGFYDQVEKRLGFFPQYYRFLLSICLDLEDLGLPGNKAEALANWVAQEGLAEAELSDLQRLEARRLMVRRGIDPLPGDAGLEDRVRSFIDRSETFAMPNKKAAYELTHIVFYLSEYGRRDPHLSSAAITSLEFAGILAYLDQNADLLAEICVALRYAGKGPSQIWESWLERETHRFSVETGPHVGTADNYHDYFVCNWLMAVSGRDAFHKETADDRMAFYRAEPYAGPLREMSECMFRLEDARSADWNSMRAHVEGSLTEIGHDILCEAQQSSDKFEDFFAGFARTGLRGVAL